MVSVDDLNDETLVPFTQYLRPDGRKRQEFIVRPADICAKAQAFIDSGGWFECEVLTTGHVSLTACANVDDEPQDIDIEVVQNGPGVGEAVDRLIERVAP